MTWQEAIRIIENCEIIFGLELDANTEARDRIEPVIVALYIPAYQHLANDQMRRENWFIEARLRRAKEINKNGEADIYIKKKEPYSNGKIEMPD